MFNYWSLPKIVQQTIKALIPVKVSWEIDATKTVTTDWVFDIPPFVKDEALTGGTEYIIDTYYIHVNGKPADVGDTIKMKVTVDKPADYDAVCTNFVKSNGGFGHDYIENNTQMTGWFCPMFEVMFGDDIPESIYIKFS